MPMLTAMDYEKKDIEPTRLHEVDYEESETVNSLGRLFLAKLGQATPQAQEALIEVRRTVESIIDDEDEESIFGLDGTVSKIVYTLSIPFHAEEEKEIRKEIAVLFQDFCRLWLAAFRTMQKSITFSGAEKVEALILETLLGLYVEASSEKIDALLEPRKLLDEEGMLHQERMISIEEFQELPPFFQNECQACYNPVESHRHAMLILMPDGLSSELQEAYEIFITRKFYQTSYAEPLWNLIVEYPQCENYEVAEDDAFPEHLSFLKQISLATLNTASQKIGESEKKNCQVHARLLKQIITHYTKNALTILAAHKEVSPQTTKDLTNLANRLDQEILSSKTPTQPTFSPGYPRNRA